MRMWQGSEEDGEGMEECEDGGACVVIGTCDACDSIDVDTSSPRCKDRYAGFSPGRLRAAIHEGKLRSEA